MAEARQLKTGRWRIYKGSGPDLVRDPETRGIVTFDSLAEARRWWARQHPGEPALEEAKKCGHCGAYFGQTNGWTLYDGLYYHPSHTPGALASYRRR
jgi:hypothetical protein